MPFPGRSALGPSAPNPVTSTTIAPGLRAAISSYVQPHRSSTRCGWFNTTTSATAVSRWTTSMPSAVSKSTHSARLLRSASAQTNVRSPRMAPVTRNGSPPGGSTFTTSAPRSPSIAATIGAGNRVARSSTRTPAKAAAGAGSPIGSVKVGNIQCPRSGASRARRPDIRRDARTTRCEMPLLDGKVAIVTGAGHGIGRGHAMELAKHGAQGRGQRPRRQRARRGRRERGRRHGQADRRRAAAWRCRTTTTSPTTTSPARWCSRRSTSSASSTSS